MGYIDIWPAYEDVVIVKAKDHLGMYSVQNGWMPEMEYDRIDPFLSKVTRGRFWLQSRCEKALSYYMQSVKWGAVDAHPELQRMYLKNEEVRDEKKPLEHEQLAREAGLEIPE